MFHNEKVAHDKQSLADAIKRFKQASKIPKASLTDAGNDNFDEHPKRRHTDIQMVR